MGYILCDNHGGNIISFASPYHADKARNQETCIASEVVRIHVIDNENLFNGNYLVDASVIKALDIKDQKIDFQTDQNKFEALMDTLTLVCSKCLDAYLNRG